MFNFFRSKREPARMMFSTDIHCHVIPGIDDGSQSVEDSVQLIGKMQEWGINKIIASPHVTQMTFENTPETIAQPLADLKQGLSDAGIDIDLSHSAEYRMDEFFTQQIAEGNLRPLPGNHLLVENSFIVEPINMDVLLFDLRIKGYTPILAHPERYAYYFRNFKRYRQLHDNGLLFQCNVLSLAGYYGSIERKIVEQLMDADMVDFLGTDLHGWRHVKAIDQYLSSRTAVKDAQRLSGRILNDKLFA